MIIVKSELQQMQASIVGACDADASDATTLSTSIEQFKAALQGKGFEGKYKDSILKNLEDYQNATNERNKLASELASKINDALNILINSMDNDTVDTSDKEELQIDLENIKNRINSLEANIESYNKLYNETKESQYQDKVKWTRQTIWSCKTMQKGIIDDIKKIERVELADAEARGKLNGLDDMMSKYKNLTTDIEALKSNIPSYTPTYNL